VLASRTVFSFPLLASHSAATLAYCFIRVLGTIEKRKTQKREISEQLEVELVLDRYIYRAFSMP
jgi:hypothetical protein